MTVCSSCVRKAKRIEKQRQSIATLRRDLREARARVVDLEKALREVCDFAEVCEHNPAREVLLVSR